MQINGNCTTVLMAALILIVLACGPILVTMVMVGLGLTTLILICSTCGPILAIVALVGIIKINKLKKKIRKIESMNHYNTDTKWYRD